MDSLRREGTRTGGACACAEPLEPRRLLSLPLGGETRVNTFTGNSQTAVAMAMNDQGNFVVAWASNEQDGDSYGIYAQRYNSAGVPQGSEFRVNTFTTSGQSDPSIAMDADGDFVIAWTSQAQDGDSSGIYAQRFNSSGAAQGSEFRVNTFTTITQSLPTVAMDASGDFVIAWTSIFQDGGGDGVYAQRYDSAGVAQGSEFRVNSFTTGDQFFPSAAMDDDGNFVVAWSSVGQDGGNYGIYAQRYNSAGVAQGGEFRVNTFTTNAQRWPSAAMDADGNFVVAWTSNQDGGSNDDGDGIYARRYNSAGAAQGTEFRVNTYTTSAQRFPSTAMNDDGRFVITWRSFEQDGSAEGVYAQWYNSAGTALGGEIRVNTTTLESQTDPAAGMDADGNFVIAWSGFDPNEITGMDAYIQRYFNLDDPFARLIDGTLLVGGTNGNDVITLALQGATLVVTRNGVVLNFVNADVERIEVYALDGNDSVTLGAGVIGSYVLGGNGNDTLVGAEGNDALVGASGKDSLRGGAGDDRVAGGKHADILFAEDGIDRVYGDEANDLLDGGTGRDRMYGGADNDTMLGGNQNDTMYGEAGSDSLHGGNHSDRLFPGSGPDTADGGAGDDNLFDVDGSIDNLIGGAGVDGHDSDITDLITLFEVEL